MSTITKPKAKKRFRFNKEWVTDSLKSIKRDKYLYLLLVPFLMYFFIFHYKPYYGLQLAFKDFSLWKGIDESPWVGLYNFKLFLQDPFFLRVLKNTFLISFYSLIFGFPAPIILALLFNEVRSEGYKKTLQTVTYLPHFISAVIVAGIVTSFLAPSNGLVNIIMAKMGLDKIYFLTKPEYFRTIYVSMNIWKETGFNSIIYIAALAGIDRTLYEAAKVDGAGRWKQMLHVTLPGLFPTIVIMLILRIGRLLKVGYETIILLYTPATYETADVISTYVYRAGMQTGKYDLATAVGLFDAIVALVLVVIANSISKKYSEHGLW